MKIPAINGPKQFTYEEQWYIIVDYKGSNPIYRRRAQAKAHLRREYKYGGSLPRSIEIYKVGPVSNELIYEGKSPLGVAVVEGDITMDAVIAGIAWD